MKKVKNDVTELKKNILSTTYDIIAEKGYAATNLQDIADKLNISRNPIYYHYKNKQTLYRAASANYLDWKKQQYDAIWSKESSSDFFSLVKEDLLFCTSIVATESYFFMESRNNPDLSDVKNAWNDTFNYVYQLKINAVLDSIKKGELRSDSAPRDVVNNLYILYYGFKGALENPLLHLVPSEVEKLIDTLIHGMIVLYKA